MNRNKKRKIGVVLCIVSFAVLLSCFILSFINMNLYNSKNHKETFAKKQLFSSEEVPKDAEGLFVKATARDSTWTKVFDLNNEGIKKHNYQAYTYDFAVANHTDDEVADFTFKLTFNKRAFLMSAWNGALEIHQNVLSGDNIVDTVPDLREFDASAHHLKTVTFDGETLIQMEPGDYLVYHPSSTLNAMEIPIEPRGQTTPGCILYSKIGETIEGSSLDIEYRFKRLLIREPLFWVSVIGIALWLIVVLNFIITEAQIRKYKKQHERDNIIINESIETFIGFIDAKDPYTNGHSKRVAIYTKQIAEKLGYEGEELDRIYYTALLHDCGKIGVPDSILSKPGKLTEEEFEIIKSHTVRGGEILSSFKSLENVGEGALYHHERYDGKGYPEGKSGKDIPIIARIICVADSFDAMNSNRVYRKKLPKEDIIRELEENKGKQFDPEIADIMLGLIRDNIIKFE